MLKEVTQKKNVNERRGLCQVAGGDGGWGEMHILSEGDVSLLLLIASGKVGPPLTIFPVS